MSSELRVDKIIPTTGVPTGGGGGIIQVVFAQTNTATDQVNTGGTQTTLFWTNLQATITPKFSTSKILVMANQNFNITTSAATQMQWNFYICNSSGTILQGAPGGDSYDQNRIKEQLAHAGTHSINFLHSPNTTNAFTYRVYGNNYSNSGSNNTTLQCQSGSRTNCFSTMTLMEISA